MAIDKCPLCDSPCIIKIISTQDERYCEVDVCKMCGTMYPRGRESVRAKPKTAKGKKAKAPRKKAKKK